MRWVFVDTNGWIALSNKRDQLHQAAIATNRTLLRAGVRYVTSNFVLDETYTGLLGKGGHAIAVSFGEGVRRANTIQVVHVNEELEEEAWNLFKRYSDKEFSFTDCTSFIIMRQLKVIEALTSDHHFEQAGFTVLLKR